MAPPEGTPDDGAPSFERRGDALFARPSTEGGWNPGTLVGRYVAGLVAFGAERHGGDDLVPARLTVDMFRPAPMGVTTLPTRVVRDGRRIRVVDVDVVVGDVIVGRGSVVFLRRSQAPRGESWSPTERTFPDPAALPQIGREGFVLPWHQRAHGGWTMVAEERGCWVGETRDLVEGVPVTPFVRAALAADNANGAINGSSVGLTYINADLTLTMARLPEGEWIAVTPVSRATADGVSTGSVELYDDLGRFGQVAMIALADERNLMTGHGV